MNSGELQDKGLVRSSGECKAAVTVKYGECEVRQYVFTSPFGQMEDYGKTG